MNSSSSSRDGACPTCGSWWRLPLLLGIVLAAILFVHGRGIRNESSPTAEAPSEDKNEVRINSEAPGVQTVSLGVDFGDGNELHIEGIDWHEGMTVAEVIAAARQKRDGTKISQQGSGAMTFLTQINEVANEGAGGRNWTYSVNGQMGDRSFAVYPLHAGDQVLWKFAAEK